MSGQAGSDGAHRKQERELLWLTGTGAKINRNSSLTTVLLRRGYTPVVIIVLLTSSVHTGKQKQLTGGCVTLRYIVIGFPTIRLHASLAFLLVKLIKSKNGFSKQLSINRAACLRGKTGDWPVLLSVSSWGIVLMIWLDENPVTRKQLKLQYAIFGNSLLFFKQSNMKLNILL